MEQKKYTFKYIHLADGLVETAMSSLRFNFSSLKFCLVSDDDKARLLEIEKQFHSFVRSVADRELSSFNDWKKQQQDAKEG